MVYLYITCFFLLTQFLSGYSSISYGDSNSHKDAHFLPGRSGIVQLFEWRFDDIAQECEQFLGPYGYAGVQVSPVNENIILDGRPWFERYQPLSYLINTRSGDEQAFGDMVARCNKAGIRVYVDVVVNHMAANNDNPIGTAGSVADPNHKTYPTAGYYPSDFHQTCAIHDYQNATNVRDCELVGLHDLDQSNANVRTRIITYFNKLISHGIAGFRVDAAKHMWPQDLRYIYSQLDNLNTEFFSEGSTPLVYQEVIDYGGEAVKATEYTGFGLATDFRFGMELGRAFRGNNPLHWLKTFETTWDLLKGSDSLVFIDNHDTQRNADQPCLIYKLDKQYKMATAFLLAFPHGTPRLMSSFYFDNFNQGPPHNDDNSIKHVSWNGDLTCGNGWVCEHRWRQIYNMIAFRNCVQGTKMSNWWDNNSNQIAFGREGKGFIAFNGDPYPLNIRLQTGMPQGTYCDIISGNVDNNSCTGKVIIVNSDGNANFWLFQDELDGVIAITEKSKLKEA